VTVDGSVADGRPRLLGPYVQGPPAGRFVYLCVGQYAGQSPNGGPALAMQFLPPGWLQEM
jgi:hypothetical protein